MDQVEKRKIVTVKRKNPVAPGTEDLEFEDSEEDEFEQEDVI